MIADWGGKRWRYGMLVIAALCQLATITITWNLWQSRDHPVALPVHANLPEISVGWAMVTSLVLVVLIPKVGIAVHWVALAAACVLDQFRLEPQFFGLAMLMVAYLGDAGLRVSRWYLVAMWIWTGIHKFLSADWMGHLSWGILDRAGLPADHWYWAFAIAVAATELGLGLLACFRPRWAAAACVVVHLGIVMALSPLFTGMNYSVVPWNVGIATVGCWILMRSDSVGAALGARPQAWELALMALFMIVPLGFYWGWVDRCFSHVMYSGNLPRGLITTKHGPVEFNGFDELAVPFPHERRLFRMYFRQTARLGDKLQIADPRRTLPDQYFVLRPQGLTAISADEFFGIANDPAGTGETLGIGIDDRRSLFALSQAGVRMLTRNEHAMVYAVAFTPETFDRRLLPLLRGLPNLQQIQFSGTDIRDADLVELKTLRLLTGLGLNQTKITDAGLRHLAGLPFLRYVEADGTAITPSPAP